VGSPPRSLGPPPDALLDAAGVPRFGAYAGPLPPIALPRLGLRDRLFRRKRWFYVALSAGDTWISLAVVHTGYAATAFVFAYDAVSRTMLEDVTVIGPAMAARVADDAHQQGLVASFSFRRMEIAIARADGYLEITVRSSRVDVSARIDERGRAPAISAIASVGAGLFGATEKRAALALSGRARCGERELGLDGGLAGYDFSQGLLPRRTAWRWAFALGRSDDGATFGFNVVEGFLGEAECAAFVDDDVVALPEPRFLFQPEHPVKAPWRLEGPGLALDFEPGAAHAQRTNLGIVRSRFVQVVGTFRGVLRVQGRELRVHGLPGVVEDQDVTW